MGPCTTPKHLQHHLLIHACSSLSLIAGEYIDDTEDLVNINLDNSRNKLIRFEILLTTGTFALSSYS